MSTNLRAIESTLGNLKLPRIDGCCKDFKSFIENEYYQYISVYLATFAFVPQIILSRKTKSLRDFSTYSLIMLFTSGTLWSFYMYETKRIIFFPCTLFMTLNILTLMYFKISFYRDKLLTSMQKIENPTSINIS